MAIPDGQWGAAHPAVGSKAPRHRPLDGITVIALEQAVSGPFATRHLADLGARVIKIERPDGGDFAREYDTRAHGLSSWFVWLNRTKESVTLDLKHPGPREALDRLIARADVFLQNLAPGAADRLRLGPETLRATHPGLIVCNISGYGPDGPYADHKAYDLIVQSEIGVVSLTGTAATPCKVGISIADVSAGMYAHASILTALFTRTRTGEGTVVDVAMFDTLGEWMGFAPYYAADDGAQPPRTGASHATVAPYGPFRTGDGSVLLAVQTPREWVRFCEDVVGQPQLAADPRFCTNELRAQHREALQAVIEGVFAPLSDKDVTGRLEAAGIAHGHMNTVAEYLHHPQITGRKRWRTVDSPAGPIQAMLPPIGIEGMEPAMGAIPSLGQHTDAVLEEIGVDRQTIAEWRQERII